jgi:hypothetical protein
MLNPLRTISNNGHGYAYALVTILFLIIAMSMSMSLQFTIFTIYNHFFKVTVKLDIKLVDEIFLFVG